jgi:hypothetical protein
MTGHLHPFHGCEGELVTSIRENRKTLKELAAWRGNRSDAGRVRPDRFLTNNKFGQLPTNGNGKAKEER